MSKTDKKEFFKQRAYNNIGAIYTAINKAKNGAKTAQSEKELELLQQQFNAAMEQAKNNFDAEHWEQAKTNIGQMERIVSKRRMELGLGEPQTTETAPHAAPIQYVETVTPPAGTTPLNVPKTAQTDEGLERENAMLREIIRQQQTMIETLMKPYI